MKDPTKDTIKAGDKVIINGALYQAVPAKFNFNSCKGSCDLLKEQELCSKVNCRDLYYKRDGGGV